MTASPESCDQQTVCMFWEPVNQPTGTIEVRVSYHPKQHKTLKVLACVANQQDEGPQVGKTSISILGL